MNKSILATVFISAFLVTACNKPVQSDNHNSNVTTNKADPGTANIALNNQTIPNHQPTSSDEPIGQDWPIKQYTLYGNKQSWRVTVDLDQATVAGSELPNGKLHVERLAYAKGVEFTGQLDSKELGLNIRTQACTDANNHKTDFTATVYYNDKIYKGCAVEGIAN